MKHSEIKEVKDLIGDGWQEVVENMRDNKDDFTVESEDRAEFRFIHDDAIFDIYVEGIEDITKDCYLGGAIELPWWLEVDWEKTAENCLVDGYGHHFSSYDGSELEIAEYYIFRTN